MDKFKYFAFISYSSQDYAWGKRLQRKLEGYNMPSTLCSRHGWERKPMRPIFFAPTDIQPGALDEELKERLRKSNHLIVICSPRSAQSEWVGKEIEYFHSLGRTKQIHFFIIDGIPHSGNSKTECFNPIVETLGIPEILGANVNEKVFRLPWLNREHAYVQLVTKLLGVEFDTVWQRHRRRLINMSVAWAVGAMAVALTIFSTWAHNRPVDVSVTLNETSVHNNNLPPLQNAIVSISIDNETKTDTIPSLDSITIFRNIPHKAIGKEARIVVNCNDWFPVDTTVILSQYNTIDIRRNPEIYGEVHFRLWNIETGKGVTNTPIVIAGITAVSDTNGFVRLFIPLEKQRAQYKVICDKELENDTISIPISESTAIIIKQ